MDKQIKLTLDKAEDFYTRAKDELCKPEEDVVPYSVCQNAYLAVVNYLKSFLMDHGVEFPRTSNVEDLLKSCREIDNQFKDLHLAPLYHPTESKDVWMNIDLANNFLDMAESTRQMVRKEVVEE